MVNCNNAGNNNNDMVYNIKRVDLSQQVLYAAQNGENTDSFVTVLASLSNEPA